MFDAVYTKAEIFEIDAETASPLHIGGPDGGNEQVLIHPERKVPFLQAFGIAGAFRALYEEKYGKDKTDELFGRNSDDGTGQIKYDTGQIKFTDGYFKEDSQIKMEIRPHIAIDRETGTAASSKVKGQSISSGHKFETEYVGAGNRFSFAIYILSSSAHKEEIESLLQAMNAHDLQLGGLKSTGSGYIKAISVRYAIYDMTKPAERKAWLSDDRSALKEQEIGEAESGRAYELLLKGRTKGELLIKDIVPEGVGDGKADAVNIKNAKGEFIIPGSSLKGVIRSRMEMIAEYKKLPEDVVLHAFGLNTKDDSNDSSKDSFEDSSYIGNLSFEDVIVEGHGENNSESVKNQEHTRAHVHIDKFTGGAMYKHLFYEKNISGDVNIRIFVTADRCPDTDYAEKTLGLLILALRDLAAGEFTLGSGYGKGKGYIEADTLEIKKKGEEVMTVNFTDQTVRDADGLFEKCMNALEG